MSTSSGRLCAIFKCHRLIEERDKEVEEKHHHQQQQLQDHSSHQSGARHMCDNVRRPARRRHCSESNKLQQHGHKFPISDMTTTSTRTRGKKAHSHKSTWPQGATPPRSSPLGTITFKRPPLISYMWASTLTLLLMLLLASMSDFSSRHSSPFGVQAQASVQQQADVNQALAQQLQVFNGNATDAQQLDSNHFKLLELIDEDTLLVGARNVVYNLSLTSMREQRSTRVEGYRHQYISDRLCQSVYSKLGAAYNSAQTNSTQHNDTLIYINQRDGARHPFWVQCFSANQENSMSSQRFSQSRELAEQQASNWLPIEHQLHDTDLSTIFDAWTQSEESSNDDQLDGRANLKWAPSQDERYDYLTSVAHHCQVSKRVPRCVFSRIGLFASPELANSSSLGGAQRCSTCGLNDSNCDNVNHCTSECGHVKSVTYPQNYGNNHRCRWTIHAPDTYYVNLSIIDFDIPSANNASKLGTCILDYLTLIDGYTGKRIGCYCNENLPPANIVSPWNELIIQFDTNSETTGRGFYFQYEFIKLQLDESIRSQLGAASNKLCLAGWQHFRGSCYRAFNEMEPLQWYDAENRCNLHGEGLDGHLVSILDRHEMLVILHWLTNVWNSTRYREYYIGLIDVTREGLYRWSDNNPMSYTDWELKPMLLEDETPAQPDGGAYEDCTVIRYNSFSRTSNWHDVPCSLGKHYHAHLEKGAKIKFKWDYVSGYICKSDSMSIGSPLAGARSKIRRPLFSNDPKPSLLTDHHLISHLSSSTNQRNSNIIQLSTDRLAAAAAAAAAAARRQQAATGSSIEYSSQPANSSSPASAPGDKQQLQQQQDFLYLAKLDDNRYFICDNFEVISTVLRCDGVAHCRDGSDESNGCDQDCLDWQFKCANGRCISIGYYCDFSDDCGDGSDESRCERHRCKLNEFRCQSGQCIPNQQRCDLLPDCRDLSDEGRSCTIGSNCNPNSTFQCYNGLCIPQYAVCDFQIDCPGKFHEDEDTITCDLLQRNQASARSTSINSNGNGLPASIDQLSAQLVSPSSSSSSLTRLVKSAKLLVAPQPHRAPMASSEVVFYPANRAASIDALAEGRFRCKSGNTIDSSQRCLFEFDKYGYQLGCRDVSHLVECADFECPQRDYVKCSASYCIPWRYVCDGKWDCIMGDDEIGCARYVCPGQYKCANQSSCILLHQLCDGHRQCPMGDDEWFCDLQCPAGCDCIGQSVSCCGVNLTSLPSNYIPKGVRKLDLSHNKLGSNLNNSNFDAYHDLGELILSHNEIEVLPPRKFHQLRNLYKLDLSYNQIHSVKRGAFAGLRRVTQLLLESNQQLFLLEPEAFLGLSSLQMLNISSSKIQSLKRNTFDGLTSLRHLLLRSNMILTIEDGAFRSLSSLVSLDMRGNDIKHFTKSVFSDLKSLRNLSSDSFKFCCLVKRQIPSDKCLPLPDEISDCEDLLSSVPQRSCIWIAGGIACVGNLIVIVWRYRDRLGQKEREEEKVNSTLLLSLAFSDLLMGIYLIIIALVDGWYRGRYIENADKWRESPLCNICGFLSTVSSMVSVLTLVFIAYNRYLEICRPFKMASKFTLEYTHSLVRFSWLLALIIATLPLVVWPYFRGQFYAKSGVCLAFHITDQRAAGWLYSILVSPCVNLASFLVIFKCYIRIYMEISRATRHNEYTERPNHQVKIVLIILTHFVAFSPPMILGFVRLAGYTPPATLYSWIAVLVLPVNSAINPLIYTLPNIRQTIKLLISNYRIRRSGAAWARNQSQQQQQRQQSNNINQPHQAGEAHELPSERALAARNVPPGYVRVQDFIDQHEELNVAHLISMALLIARDIEQKHAQSKVYVSLQVNEIYVSNKMVQQIDDSLTSHGTVVNAGLRAANELTNEQSIGSNQLAVFVADHDGYRQKKAQSCTHSNNLHHHRHHKTTLTCECFDVARFGDILFKLIQLYNRRRLYRAREAAIK